MSVYEGKFPYIFISYAHKNNKAVMRVVDALERRGYRVWFDEGIAPGSEWPENIAQHLADSAVVIAFITRQSMESPNCRREIHFALSRKKPLLSIFLEETELPLGMELQLAAQQSILRYNYRTEEEFLEKICGCEVLLPCLIQNGVPFGGWNPPAAQEVRRNSRRPKGIGIAAAAVCAVALLAGGLFFWRSSRSGEPSAALNNPGIRTELPRQTEAQTEAPEETAPAVVHYMRPAESLDELKAGGYDKIVSNRLIYHTAPFWGQTEYRREQVEMVRFQGTLDGVPASVWDASEAGDWSVLAWMDGGTLRVAADGKIGCRDASYLFYHFENLTAIDWGGCFDTSETVKMRSMFTSCSKLTELDVSGFDTSKVTDMSYMFSGCYILPALDVSGFDTSNVTAMPHMFDACHELVSLDVSGFDTSNVVNMEWMFGNCFVLKALDVSGFDTSHVTNMEAMFRCCYELAELDVSGFDVSQVRKMEAMFQYCNALPDSAVPGWYTGAR